MPSLPLENSHRKIQDGMAVQMCRGPGERPWGLGEEGPTRALRPNPTCYAQPQASGNTATQHPGMWLGLRTGKPEGFFSVTSWGGHWEE